MESMLALISKGATLFDASLTKKKTTGKDWEKVTENCTIWKLRKDADVDYHG